MKLPQKKAGPQTSDDGLISADDLEARSLNETSAILDAFKDRAKNENARLLDATDSEHWIAICFQSREMKEEILRKLDLIKHGDKYLDGMKVARALGVKLESPVPSNRKITRFKRDNIPTIP